MKFHAVPIEQAVGCLLGHNLSDASGRRLRKGREISREDVEVIRRLGRSSVYVAELEAGDLQEDACAEAMARVLAVGPIRASRASTGRVNFFSQHRAVLRCNPHGLASLNALSGITLATLGAHSAVDPGKMIATLKIIPYALPKSLVEQAVDLIEEQTVFWLDPLRPTKVGLVLSGSAEAEERITQSFTTALSGRIEALGSTVEQTHFVSLRPGQETNHLAEAIQQQLDQGVGLILLAGETAIMDVQDIAPLAVESLGASIECYGAPVDPGNLLLLAYAGKVPIVGAPGCSRSPKANIIDLVLPRLLAAERLRAQDIHQLGLGGLLEDVPERPLPRSWLT